MSKKATIIAVVNQKGGTGKTTTTENLGVGLALEGKKVLLVDTDPQASLTVSLGNPCPDDLSPTLSDLMGKIMMENPITPDEGILHHPEGVDLVPSNIELSGMEVALVNAMSRETILRQYLDTVKQNYDYILLDCMPSLGMLTVNALAAADNVLIPVQAAYLPAKGLEQLLGTINKVKRQINPKLRIEGILLTMVDSRTNYSKDISNLIRESYGGKLKVYKTDIPRSVRAEEISAEGTSIFKHDPKGSIVIECGNALLKHGYTIKIFNTINFQKSMHYNPFAYIHSEKDILKLVTTLIANTKGDGKAGDEFWTKAETLLYCALIGYIHYEAPVEEQNFSTLIEFLNAMEVREDDEEFQNPVDLMFEALEKKKPNHFAVRQYKKYKLAAGKTAKSILISCGARLAPFDIQEVRDVTAYDELQLDTLGDKKTALFLIMSDTDATFNFLISMIYTQLFNLLCEKADDVYGGRLPVHVRCLIDEMANIGQIPNLEKLVATIRSREISACLVLQAQSQLKAIYKDNADTIIGNMDSRIFLGGSEPTTLKELNQALGKETIDTYNTSNTRGNSPSYGLNYQKLGKDLASVDELAVLDGSKCILQLRGVRPFLSDKYDLTQHPNYKYTSDFDKRNEFNIEQFLSRRLKLKAGDEFVVVDAD